MSSKIWICPNALRSYTAIRNNGNQTITVDVDKVNLSYGNLAVHPRAIVHLPWTNIQTGSGTSGSIPGSTSNTTYGPWVDLPRMTQKVTFNFSIKAHDVYVDYGAVGQVWTNYYSMNMWAELWVDKGNGAEEVVRLTHIGTYSASGTSYSELAPAEWNDSIAYDAKLGANEDAIAQLRIGKTRRSWRVKAPGGGVSLWEYNIKKPYVYFPEEDALAAATLNYCVIGE